MNTADIIRQLRSRAKAQRMAGQPSYALLEDAARELERLDAIVRSRQPQDDALGQGPQTWPPKPRY